MHRTVWFTILLFAIATCHGNAQSGEVNVASAAWLEGAWAGPFGNKVYLERWTHSEDGNLHGNSWIIAGNDTTLSETLLIQVLRGNLVYVASPKNQEPTLFTMTRASEDTLVFENPEHDFPTAIIYARSGEDNLHARIEGEIKGKKRSMDFYLVKMRD